MIVTAFALGLLLAADGTWEVKASAGEAAVQARGPSEVSVSEAWGIQVVATTPKETTVEAPTFAGPLAGATLEETTSTGPDVTGEFHSTIWRMVLRTPTAGRLTLPPIKLVVRPGSGEEATALIELPAIAVVTTEVHRKEPAVPDSHLPKEAPAPSGTRWMRIGGGIGVAVFGLLWFLSRRRREIADCSSS